MATNNEVKCDIVFERLSVRELRLYLKDRGENVSGNRPELIKRARGLLKLGKRTLKEIEISDNVDHDVRQCQLFTTPLGDKLPTPSDIKECWDENLDKVPNFRKEDLYNYLVLSKSRTHDKENRNAKRQLKAEVFYEDSAQCTIPPDYPRVFTLLCPSKVIPSLPTDNKKKDHDAWVCLAKMSGMVHAAGCICTAG
ncbi:hypothetical protein DPMN_126917 [Dreissena polymorpha]|uniref:SAP domain-containing protein n=2 Tax=Dreissena polymorpha TaxID=45954 RepID=A0A9D4GXZ4_DREPO|nr:hypothetical protein DPMN_126917 [Dreissena polymorpha]